jgi:hypothetical protein
MLARVALLGLLPPPVTRPPVNAWDGSLMACACWGAARAAAPTAAGGQGGQARAAVGRRQQRPGTGVREQAAAPLHLSADGHGGRGGGLAWRLLLAGQVCPRPARPSDPASLGVPCWRGQHAARRAPTGRCPHFKAMPLPLRCQ